MRVVVEVEREGGDVDVSALKKRKEDATGHDPDQKHTRHRLSSMDWAAMSLLPPLLLSLTLPFPRLATATPFVVQRLSSRYALLLGGYGPGYEELNEVEVVKHDRVCQGAVA